LSFQTYQGADCSARPSRPESGQSTGDACRHRRCRASVRRHVHLRGTGDLHRVSRGPQCWRRCWLSAVLLSGRRDHHEQGWVLWCRTRVRVWAWNRALSTIAVWRSAGSAGSQVFARQRPWNLKNLCPSWY